MGEIHAGERVSVMHTSALRAGARGRIASPSTGFLSGEGNLSFVVLLDEGDDGCYLATRGFNEGVLLDVAADSLVAELGEE